MRDQLRLHGLRYQTAIGSTAAERAFPQAVVLDVDLAVDTAPAAQSGALDATVCWATVESTIRGVIETRARVLVEELVHDLAVALLSLDSRIESARITAKKFPFPHAEWVGVTIERSRADLGMTTP